MDDRAARAVAALKLSKQKGLPYFQAAQELLQQGFTQAEIDQAAIDAAYVAPKVTPDANSQTESAKEIEKEESELQELKDEDSRQHYEGFGRFSL